MFTGPIPGESLTRPPKNFPWERPSQFSDPEDVIEFYLSKLTQEETAERLLDLLETGETVKDLVTGMLRIGVSEGIHSVDVSLLVAPVIHEFIKSLAKQVGVEFEEGLVDKAAKEKEAKAVKYLKTKRQLSRMKTLVEEIKEPEAEEPVEEEMPLIKRRGM